MNGPLDKYTPHNLPHSGRRNRVPEHLAVAFLVGLVLFILAVGVL